MCGIAGVIDMKSRHAGAEIVTMIARMRHRGPDDEGFLFADMREGRTHAFRGANAADVNLPLIDDQLLPRCDVSLGHCRLAILDLTAAGHQPMPNEYETLWIVYNGEIYNYRELREELEQYGHRFRTQTDTEVVLAAYAEWGTDCLEKFNGMWAFSILDLPNNRVFIARDRFGIKPFYYVWDGRMLVFASEIKALLAHPSVDALPNAPIIYDYLSLGSLDHTEDTFFEGIRKLPAAEFMVLDLDQGSLIRRRWWSPCSAAISENRSAEAICEEFRELLTSSIRLRLRSDVPVGTCLSGGLDSSSVAGVMSDILREERDPCMPDSLGTKQRTFSACFQDLTLDESPYMRQVVNMLDAQAHYVYPKGSTGLWKEICDLAWHQDEPFSSTAVYSQRCVMALAKEAGVTVLLDGQGGDELLAGYHYYYGLWLAGVLRAGNPLKAMTCLWKAAAASARSRVFLFALMTYCFAPRFLRTVALSFGNSSLRTNPVVPDGLLDRTFAKRYSGRRMQYARYAKTRNLRDQLWEDLSTWSLPALLRYEDRNSMTYSLEARIPFLDYRLVEFVMSLPDAFRIRNGWTKWVLRESMEGVIPESVRWRRTKLGFTAPEASWLAEGREVISQMYQGKILSTPYLGRHLLDRLQHASEGDLGKVPGLWRLICLESWMRAFWGKPMSD